MPQVIESVAGCPIASGKILGGLAILEDAYHDTAQVTALPASMLIESEKELLNLTKSWMGKIPVPALDVLIVDEVGKNIAGTGMGLKVVTSAASTASTIRIRTRRASSGSSFAAFLE